MKISEIILLEQENVCITLHKEGVFWKAYELSAYRFVQSVKAYNVKCKYYKNIKQDVVYIGFPSSSFDSVSKICMDHGYKIEYLESTISISNNIDTEGYVSWKDDIVQSTMESNNENKGENVTSKRDILSEIVSYPLATKTPMEAQHFLYEIQLKLHGVI
jgi:hypothetical protein